MVKKSKDSVKLALHELDDTMKICEFAACEQPATVYLRVALLEEWALDPETSKLSNRHSITFDLPENTNWYFCWKHASLWRGGGIDG